ncbi:hypothetical protein FRACA_40052 [Frankia canadensis]|uniref:Uncharacterized protein n=1 Tax=Frankia canadensis TaxID=1836972 RepID=A0A2I2KWJ4_9ACTN|nr:hypothetical protein FRACA_40052 [Frankia canadensis]SOU57314.1 hypothetical protein FRACA_40052 [Frankia canadensis]
MPTNWANRGGAGSSVLAGGPSRGLINARKTTAYGAYRTPAAAPMAKTTVWASSSHPLPVTSTTASTTVVTAAVNRMPRGSVTGLLLTAPDYPIGYGAKQGAPINSDGADPRSGKSDTGSCSRGTGRPRGAAQAASGT